MLAWKLLLPERVPGDSLNWQGPKSRFTPFAGEGQPAFLTLDRSEAVEMAVDTRRATRKRVPRGPRKRTVWYVEEADRVEHCGRGHIRRRSRLGVRNAG